MQISKADFTSKIKAFEFRELFNYFGWNNDKTKMPVEVDGLNYLLNSVAEKSGFRVLICSPNEAGLIPNYAIRKKIDTKVTTLFQEHLIIFCNALKTEQVWQFIHKQTGKPSKVAEIKYNISQVPEKLYQRTSGLFFSIDEEEKITIIDVSSRVSSNFGANAEKVTKKFYDGFKKQHNKFLDFIKGIEGQLNKEWYASLMLNRLMFCYFIQKKGFLDDNKKYLRDKLNQCQQKHGKGKFYSFYRNFLLVLFHKGFGTYMHSEDLIKEIGRVPYLNGGLFDIHEIEQSFPDIDISDEAFVEIFDFFDQYDWHLDTRVTSSGNEINPDVLGYIFEKYINDRAQMGAYYTQEDITEYISRNCIIPYLFEETKRKYPIAFEKDGQIWQILKESGDKYIFDAVKKGVEFELPSYIDVGLDTTAPDLLERRKEWNKTADDEYALPTEIWREVVERRKRYAEVKSAIESGSITSINDFITFNLNIRQFMQDIIQYIDDSDFIIKFYKVLNQITILDPTCGSGAFLFAALNVLEPLYDGCIQRMEYYIEESADGKKKYRYFEDEIEKIENDVHPNREYYIYKSIILNNLYGVDIMKEAVETAKLRLFLKLVATVEPVYNKDNLGLEPLPDVDFNIKAGNTLVGYATESELDDALSGTIDGIFARGEIKDSSSELSKAYARYKKIQLDYGENFDDFKQAKKELINRQQKLNNKLNKLMYEDYGGKYEKWLSSYQPFHWFAEFYEIIEMDGGFDVIIGNPPYVEYNKVKETYTISNFITEKCGNLYGYVIERSNRILQKNGLMGMIIPISAFSNSSMESLQTFFKTFPLLYVSNYHQRPATLFDGVLQRLSIFILFKQSVNKGIYSTMVCRWKSENRELLFPSLKYSLTNQLQQKHMLKVGTNLESSILNKFFKHKVIALYMDKYCNNNNIYYRTAGGGYWVTILNSAFATTSLSNKSSSFNKEYNAKTFSAILNSNLFWWYYSINFDQFNFKDYMIFGFRFNYSLDARTENNLIKLSEKLESELLANSTKYVINSKTRGKNETITYHKYSSKYIMDEIDNVLAKHYGLTEEELDFIINYDIKYRMGIASNEEDE